VFTSTYDCKIDDKGRVSLPGKLKSELMPVMADGFILKRSVFSPCLELWPKQEWDKKLASINELTRFNRKNAKVVRSFLAGVKSVEFDSAGTVEHSQRSDGVCGHRKNGGYRVADQHHRDLG
jgi:MraZ protein